MIGDSVQLDCEVEFAIENSMSWYFEKINIYNYNKGCVEYPAEETKYYVKRKEQHFILEIRDITLQDAGTYKCSTLSEVKLTNLIIFGK